jgi:hypothetical protein
MASVVCGFCGGINEIAVSVGKDGRQPTSWKPVYRCSCCDSMFAIPSKSAFTEDDLYTSFIVVRGKHTGKGKT